MDSLSRANEMPAAEGNLTHSSTPLEPEIEMNPRQRESLPPNGLITVQSPMPKSKEHVFSGPKAHFT